MRCSMMFNRGLSLALVVWLVWALVAPIHAGAEAPFLPDGSGNILLVHSRTPGDTAAEGIEKLVTAGAAMGKTVDFGTPEQCAPVLDRYEYVILYDLADMEGAFATAVRKTHANLMVIGSQGMERYLKLTGNSDRITGQESQKNGLLTYTFPSGESCEGVVGWDTLYRCTSDGYESGLLQAGSSVYPFCAEVAGVRFVPVQDLHQTLVLSALMQEIVQWMWPYKDRPTEYAQFLVLDSVYPFMPASQLMQTVEQVEQTSIPYVISVMPLTANTEYPAMTQFCQVLAYAQSRGATIILHAPLLHKDIEDPEELAKLLTEMTMPYFDNGVYPVGIEVPLSWLHREPYLTVLERYRTVFVYDDGGSTGFDLDHHTSRISRQGHQLVFPLMKLDQTGISQLECYASATYIDCSTERDQLARYAEASRTGGRPFMDLREFNHTVWINSCSMIYEDRTVYLNGKRMDTTFQPVEYDENFDFQRSPLMRMSMDLKNQNRFLMAVVVILMTIFLSFIVYARRTMRKRFLSGSGNEKE